MGATAMHSQDNLVAFQNYVLVQKSDHIKVWRHLTSKDQVEQYRIILFNEEHERLQKDSYEFRKYCPFVVKSYEFISGGRQELCSQTRQASLFLERIPLRLSDIKDLPYPDVLHLLDSALRGFSILYSKAGYFQVSEGMFGINLQGKVKVWMNEDFSKSAPQLYANSVNHGEEVFIERILTLIDLNSEQQPALESFYVYNRKFPPANFQNTLHRLYRYTKAHNMDIPIQMACTDAAINKYFSGGDKGFGPKKYKSPFANGEDSVADMKISLTSNRSGFTPAQVLKKVGSEVGSVKPNDTMKNSIDNYWETPIKPISKKQKKPNGNKIIGDSRIIHTISVVPNPPTAVQIQTQQNFPKIDDDPYGIGIKETQTERSPGGFVNNINTSQRSISGPKTIIRRQLEYIVEGDILNNRKNIHFPAKTDRSSAINVRSLKNLGNSVRSIFPSASLTRIRPSHQSIPMSTSVSKRLIM